MTHSFSWVAWLLASLILLLTTRNPLLLSLILILLLTLGVRLIEPGNRKRWLGQNLSFIGTMLFLSSLINLMFTHSGSTVLFSLPENWFLIGGRFTLESMLYGAINGLVISSLYLAFTVFNKALSVEQLTRLIPNAFYPLDSDRHHLVDFLSLHPGANRPDQRSSNDPRQSNEETFGLAADPDPTDGHQPGKRGPTLRIHDSSRVSGSNRKSRLFQSPNLADPGYFYGVFRLAAFPFWLPPMGQLAFLLRGAYYDPDLIFHPFKEDQHRSSPSGSLANWRYCFSNLFWSYLSPDSWPDHQSKYGFPILFTLSDPEHSHAAPRWLAAWAGAWNSAAPET